MKPTAAARAFPDDEYPFQQLTGEIIGACYEVYRVFGYGFVESVYRRALTVELEFRGIHVAQEVPYEPFHRGVSVGIYRADLVGGETILLETKTGRLLDSVAPSQFLNCLCASHLPVGPILYFGPRPSVKRIVASRGYLENL